MSRLSKTTTTITTISATVYKELAEVQNLVLHAFVPNSDTGYLTLSINQGAILHQALDWALEFWKESVVEDFTIGEIQ